VGGDRQKLVVVDAHDAVGARGEPLHAPPGVLLAPGALELERVYGEGHGHGFVGPGDLGQGRGRAGAGHATEAADYEGQVGPARASLEELLDLLVLAPGGRLGVLGLGIGPVVELEGYGVGILEVVGLELPALVEVGPLEVGHGVGPELADYVAACAPAADDLDGRVLGGARTEG